MASLVLLLSELLRHHEPNFAYATPPRSSSSCSFASAPPPSCGASMSFTAKKPLRSDRNKQEPVIVEEDPQELRVSVDLVWP
ncbi:hypothetical protein COLO4_25827 [Corchorus olitorius]|uniref:Uncharacterized protein n=1 Tax=Corchorus olitorius TaxID=93759 RepID=A0A1R3HZV7_9ROSI|nr:hypothetical protein COLO4_25827 [Corchorus olitorius]